MSWPPKQAKLTADDFQTPDDMRAFLSTSLTGNKAPPEICSLRVQRLVNASGQDMIFGVTCGRVKSRKHILLRYAVKSLTNNVELIEIINLCGRGISYSQFEEGQSSEVGKNTRKHDPASRQHSAVH